MVGFLAAQEGSRLYLVAARDNTYYLQRSGNASLGNLIDTMANTATGDMADVLGDRTNQSDPRNALALQPLVDGAAIQGSYYDDERHIRAVSDRMGELRSVRTDRGGIWNQSFGAAAYQRADNSAHAYNAHVWGTVFGADRYVTDHLLAGCQRWLCPNRMVKNDLLSGIWRQVAIRPACMHIWIRLPFTSMQSCRLRTDTYETSRRIAFGMTDGRQKAGSADSIIPDIWKPVRFWTQEC